MVATWMAVFLSSMLCYVAKVHVAAAFAAYNFQDWTGKCKRRHYSTTIALDGTGYSFSGPTDCQTDRQVERYPGKVRQ